MNTTKKLESNLKIMMLHNIFCEPFFWGPILIFTLQDLAHMSLQEIYILEAVCVVISLVIDIPTGALSDIIGRKKMLVIAQVFLFASFLFFAFMQNAGHAWCANILWGIGAAFKSGTDKALLQETCIALKKEETYYRKYTGKAQGYRLLLMAIAAPVTTWIASYDLRIPMYLSIPTLFIPLICVFRLSEPPREIVELTIKEHATQMKKGCTDVWKDNRIIWIIGYTCVISVISKIWFFAYNPYSEIVGLKIINLGWVFLLLNMVAWLSSRFGHIVEEKIGDRGVAILLIPMIGIPILLMGLIPIPFMVYMVLFQNIVRGMYGPFIDGMTARFLKSETRATVLSVQSSIISVAGAIGLWVFGLVVDKIDLLKSLTILGGVTLLGYVILMSVQSKTFKNIE
jgi:MFS family permease